MSFSIMIRAMGSLSNSVICSLGSSSSRKMTTGQSQIGITLTLLLSAAVAFAVETGGLKLEVLGALGNGARNHAQVLSSDGTKVAEVAPGQTIQLAPGTYKLV